MGGQNPEGRSQVSYVNALEGLNFDDDRLRKEVADAILRGDLRLFVLDVASWRNDQEQVQTDYTGLQRLLTNAVGKAESKATASDSTVELRGKVLVCGLLRGYGAREGQPGSDERDYRLFTQMQESLKGLDCVQVIGPYCVSQLDRQGWIVAQYGFRPAATLMVTAPLQPEILQGVGRGVLPIQSRYAEMPRPGG